MDDRKPLAGGSVYDGLSETLYNDPESIKPVYAYMAFIDQLVADALQDNMADHIESGKPFPEWGVNAKYNVLLASLTKEQLALVGDLIRNARESGYHDVLANFAWWEGKGLGLSYNGEVVPVNFAEGWHLDFVGRLDDWEWPDPE